MISIITVSYNAVSTIEQTIRSVAEQTYSNIEHVVIDGGSSDGTAEVIRSWESGLAYWTSEPDDGIADAMNKGLDLAMGHYVLYLNADDYLIDSRALERVMPSVDGQIAAGPIVKRGDDGDERVVYPRGFNWWMNFKTGLHHQATFCSWALLKDLGGFDTRYKLEMDYELFLRAYRRRVPVQPFREPFAVMRAGGVSTLNDTDTLKKRFREECAIHFRHCPNQFMRAVYLLYWRLYPPYRLLRGSLDRRRARAMRTAPKKMS